MDSLSSGIAAEVLQRLNAFAEAGGYIDYVRDPRNAYLSLPLSLDPGRGNELTARRK